MRESSSIVLFASGSGTNAENIIRQLHLEAITKVEAVFCNNPDAGVISRAENLGITVRMFSRSDLQTGALLKQLLEIKPDLIVLAGFLWLIPHPIISAFEGRILNIHPALLPKYGGKGMYGERVHQAVIAAKESESGISIHLVNEHYDEGDILFQARCPVMKDDTPATLAQRIHQLEYKYFPAVVADYLAKLDRAI